jgi:hypothetical protein
MGKQLRFYMADSDEMDFIEYLRTTGDTAILPQTSKQLVYEDEFARFSDFAGRDLGEGIHLWNRTISPPPSVKHFPQQGYYCLDFMSSEVINVIRSKMSGNRLSMGRLHIEDKFLTADRRLELKSPEFEEWFIDLCRWIKQRSVQTIDGARVLPGASALISKGTLVTGHVF